MVLNQILAEQWMRGEAVRVLGLSERQLRRLLAAYAADGPAALVRGKRGRTPAHALPEAVRARLVELARDQYAGFNRQHLVEKLVKDERIAVRRTTVRRLLDATGIASPRPRRPPKHRQWRERLPQAGMLLQADGSRHDWLEGRGPWLTRIGGIDDATGRVPWALFREQEDAHGYLRWLWQVVLRGGIPLALSVDRHGIFQRSPRQPLSLERSWRARRCRRNSGGCSRS